MNSQPVKTENYGTQLSSPLAIVSLDSLKSSVPLYSGMPHQLATGITVSVLQSSAEALIEINESAEAAVLIDGKPAAELISVKPGQIIQIASGQFAVLKSLQGIIAPRSNEYVRPAHVTKMIQLVLASLEEQNAANEANSPAAALPVAAPTQTVDLSVKSTNSKTARLPARTIILAGVTAIILGAGYYQMNTVPVQPEPVKIVQQSKSSIKLVKAIPAAEAPEAEAPAPSAVVAAQESPAATTKAPAVNAAVKISAVDALRAASGSGEAPKRPVAATKVAESNNSAGPGLSPEYRETVIEYKLEARFDRTKAREKMQKLATKFAVGTKARAEVERAYGSM